MSRKNYINYLQLVILGLLSSCAQVSMPNGGAKDEEPPRMLTALSTPNEQTQFVKQVIELEFDEWIKLSNPSKEIFISPPLDYPLAVDSRGKKVSIKFHENEILKENTTYQINLGQSVRDLTEGNKFDEFVFLFSTGDKIDELSLSGRVVDGEDGKGVGDILVLLHDNPCDTCFVSGRPLYVTRTEKTGEYSFQNLRADTFQIHALLDENVSYNYDLPSEKVAFYDSLVILSDTMQQDIELLLFDEEDPLELLETQHKTRGKTLLWFSRSPDSVQVTLYNQHKRSYQEVVEDSLLIWHDDLVSDSTILHIAYEGEMDTVNVRSGKENYGQRVLQTADKRLELLATDTVFVEFNHPLLDVDTSRVSIKDTTLVERIIDYGVEGRKLWINAVLEPAVSYDLVLDSAAVYDWYSNENQSRQIIKIETIDPSSLGQISMSFSNTNGLIYLMELYHENDLVERFSVSTDLIISRDKMLSGLYSLKIVADTDANGRWSSGSLSKKKYPELRRELNFEELKAGWELEVPIDIQELFYGTKSN